MKQARSRIAEYFLRIKMPALAAVGCVITGLAFATELEVSSDGRFGSKCTNHTWPRQIGSKIERLPLCVPPFIRVIARPEDFHGRLIALTGVLVIDGRTGFLYPTVDAVRYHDYGSALELDGDLGTFKKLRRDRGKSAPIEHVTVIGRFDAKMLGRGAVSILGALELVTPPKVSKP